MEKHDGNVSPGGNNSKKTGIIDRNQLGMKQLWESAIPTVKIPLWCLNSRLELAGLAELRTSVESVQPHAIEGKDKGQEPRGKRAGMKHNIRMVRIPVRDRGNKVQE